MSNQDVYNAPQGPWSYPRGLPQSWQQALNTTQAPEPEQQQQPQQPPPLPGPQQQASLSDLASATQGGGFAGGGDPKQQEGGYQQPTPAPRPQQHPQQYIASRRDRPPHEWGTEDWALKGADNYPGLPPGPFMPQGQDMWGLIHSISDGLGQGGSNNVAASARPMQMYAQNMSKAYVEGQLAGYRLNYARLQQSLAETAVKQQKENLQYKELFAAYGPRKETVDGKEVDNPGDPDRLKEGIEQLAAGSDDPILKAALHDGGVQAAERVLAARDGHSQDAEKILKMQILQQRLENLKRQGAKGDTIAPYLEQHDGTTPGAAPAAPAQQPLGPNEDRAPPPGPDEPVATDGKPESDDSLDWGSGDTGSGAAAAPKAGPPEPDEPAPPEDRPEEDPPERSSQAPFDAQHPLDQIAEDTGAQPPRRLFAQASPQDQARVAQQQREQPPRSRVLDQAYNTPIPGHPGEHLDRGVVNGIAEQLLLNQLNRTQLSKMNPMVLQWAQRRQLEMMDQVEALRASPLKGEQVMNELRKISPRMANGLDDVIRGRRGPPTGAQLDRPPWNMALSLASKIDPTINAYTFANRKKIMADATPGGRLGQQARYIHNARLLLEAAIAAVGNQPGWFEKFAVMHGGQLGEDIVERINPGASERVGYTQGLLIDAIAETEKAVTNGKPTQTERSHQEEATNILSKGRKNITGQLEARFLALQRTLQDMEDDYAKGTGFKGTDIFHGGGIDPKIQQSLDRVRDWKSHSAAPPAASPAAGKPAAPAAGPGGAAAPKERTIGNKTYYQENGKWYER